MMDGEKIQMNDINYDNTKQNEEISPNEIYQFQFTKDELNEIHRLQRKTVYRGPIIFALVCAFLIIYAIGESVDGAVIGFVFGAFLIGTVSHIKSIRLFKKTWENTANRICKSTYEHKIFEDYIHISIYRENEKVHESKYSFADIEKIQQFDKWLFLQLGGTSVYSPKK